SRRRHTRLVSDWSSDVCSSDLIPRQCRTLSFGLNSGIAVGSPGTTLNRPYTLPVPQRSRSPRLSTYSIPAQDVPVLFLQIRGKSAAAVSPCSCRATAGSWHLQEFHHEFHRVPGKPYRI